MSQMKRVYNDIFMWLAEQTTIDYVINLEYEYGIEEVIKEAYKRGYLAKEDL